MRNSGVKFKFVILCLLCVLFAVSSKAVDEVVAGKIKALETEHEVLKEMIKKAEKEAHAGNEEHSKFQHDIVYSHEVGKKLYKDMKALEKEFIEKKKQLDDWMKKLPEYRESVKKWQKSYSRVTDLKKQEVLLRNELKALRYKAGTIKE